MQSGWLPLAAARCGMPPTARVHYSKVAATHQPDPARARPGSHLDISRLLLLVAFLRVPSLFFSCLF